MTKNSIKKGMSMVEILVVIGLTSMLLIGAMSMLSSAIRVQSETLARQSMIDQASYVLDIMTKELRMSRRDYMGECNAHLVVEGTPTSSTYGIGGVWDEKNNRTIDNARIWFLSQEESTCLEYLFDPASSTVKVGSFGTTTGNIPPTFYPGVSLDTSRHIPRYNPDKSLDAKMNYINLFSDDIIVDRFVMKLNDPTGQMQPMITISMTLRHKIKTSLAPVDIQTTVSARNINWSPD